MPPPDFLPDEALIVKAIQGDKQAFADLYERYLDAIYRYIYYRVANRVEAEDLTEQVFLKIWEYLPRIGTKSPIRNFRAWIYRISHNLVVDHQRKHRQPVSVEDVSSLENEDPAPEDILLEKEEGAQLALALSQLDSTSQQVIVCRFVNRLSHGQTAQIMGKSKGHIRVLQHRALQKLKKIIEEDMV